MLLEVTKMRTWTKFAALLLISMLLVTTIACSNGNNTNNAKPANTNQTEKVNVSNDGNVDPAGFPISKEPISLKIFSQRSAPNGPYKDMLMFQEYEKMTNISINWEDVSADGFAERKNLLFASNELPDALFKAGITQLEAVRYGSSGMLIPLEGLINSHAPNFSNLLQQYPEMLSSITAPDGHIYALPAVVTLNAGRTNKPWINTAWLEKLGLDAPKTTDELITVLQAFKDGDPNGNGEKDEIPFTSADPNWLIRSLGGSWGLDFQLGFNINVVNDDVQIWLMDDKFKDFLQYLNRLYEADLIDKEIFTQTFAQFVAKMASGNVGFFHNQASDPFAAQKDNFEGIAPFVGPFGDQRAWSNPVARDFGTFAITNVNKHPEATIRWVDHFFGDEGSIFFRYGIEGETYNFKDDGKPEYTDEIWSDPRGTGTTIGQFTPWPGGGAPQLINVDNASAINPAEVQLAQDQMDPYLPDQVFGAPIFDEATSKEVNILRQDIDTYVNETTSKLITGSVKFDKWDEYVNTLKKMNIDRLEEIYQAAYDLTK
jgi:putative aldouronate transport system substrate-binding protein